MPYTFRLLCSLPFAQLINRTWQDTFGQCDALSPFPDQELEGHGREAIEGKEAEAMEEKGVAAAGVNRSPDNRGYLFSRFDNNASSRASAPVQTSRLTQLTTVVISAHAA